MTGPRIHPAGVNPLGSVLDENDRKLYQCRATNCSKETGRTCLSARFSFADDLKAMISKRFSGAGERERERQGDKQKKMPIGIDDFSGHPTVETIRESRRSLQLGGGQRVPHFTNGLVNLALEVLDVLKLEQEGPLGGEVALQRDRSKLLLERRLPFAFDLGRLGR